MKKVTDKQKMEYEVAIAFSQIFDKMDNETFEDTEHFEKAKACAEKMEEIFKEYVEQLRYPLNHKVRSEIAKRFYEAKDVFQSVI